MSFPSQLARRSTVVPPAHSGLEHSSHGAKRPPLGWVAPPNVKPAPTRPISTPSPDCHESPPAVISIGLAATGAAVVASRANALAHRKTRLFIVRPLPPAWAVPLSGPDICA